jgi:hypothetical protein
MEKAFTPIDKDRILPSLKAETDVPRPCSKLMELYECSSVQTWGIIKADRGLLLLGVKIRGDSFYKHCHPTGIEEKWLEIC